MAERLVRIGAMTVEQREKVLGMQNDGDERMFGEIAIDLSFIDDNAIFNFLASKGL
jgi:hypothetical protein